MAGGAEIKLDRKAWDKLLAKVRARWKDIEKRKEYATVIAAPVYADIIKHFEKEEGPDGPWRGWSAVYTEHMKRIGRATNKKLQFSGKLRQSFTPTQWRAQLAGILFYNNAKVAGSDFPYAYAHDTGGPKLPQRKFMWVSDEAMAKIISITEAWLNPDKGK